MLNFQNISLSNTSEVIRTHTQLLSIKIWEKYSVISVNEKQYICSVSLGGHVHLTSNQLHSINKEELRKPGLLKTSSLKMHHFKWMFVENEKFIRFLGVTRSIQLAMSIPCWITFTGLGCNFLSNFIGTFSNISCFSQNAKYCFQG